MVFFPALPYTKGITHRSKTLIDNILFNKVNDTAISENLIIDISDHHAQFLITPNILDNETNKMTFRRCFKNFESELFK